MTRVSRSRVSTSTHDGAAVLYRLYERMLDPGRCLTGENELLSCDKRRRGDEGLDSCD